MTPKAYYRTKSKARVEEVAIQAGTTLANFRQITFYGGAVSRALAKRLAEASDGEMTREEILYQAEYEDGDAAPSKKKALGRPSKASFYERRARVTAVKCGGSLVEGEG